MQTNGVVSTDWPPASSRWRVLADVTAVSPGIAEVGDAPTRRKTCPRTSSLGNQYPKLDTCDFFLTVKQMSDCQVSPENQGITQHGAPDHGVVHYHTGGTFYFVVDSYGSWMFTVTGSGRASGVGPWPHCSNDG